MEIFNLDPIQAAIIVGMVAGTVELVKRAFEKDFKTVAVIIGAAAAGALSALLLSINPLIGAVVGLASSGFITIVQNVGKDGII